MSDQLQNVGVLGAGYIGAVLAAEFAQRGATVRAVDLDGRRVDAINQGLSPVPEPGLDELITAGVSAGRLSASTDLSTLSDMDVILLTVGTPLGEGHEADLSHLRDACKQLASVISKDTLVLVKSTVPPGTTADVVAPILRSEAEVAVAFSPERLAEGTAIADMRRLPVVVGGVDEQSARRAESFWSSYGFEVVPVSDSRAAELVKLADNAWIDLNIAFAHELAMLCDRLGTDVLDVIRAANTLPKGGGMVNILLPSVGVGGYCLTKDPWFLNALGERLGVPLNLSAAGRRVNEAAPEYLWGRTETALAGSDLAGRRVGVLGIAFKNDTGDVRFSPAIDYVRAAIAAGAEVRWYDPLVHDHDVPDDLAASRVTSWQEAIQDAAAVAWLAAHAETRALSAAELAAVAGPGAVVVDGRRFLNAVEREELSTVGLSVVGVGW